MTPDLMWKPVFSAAEITPEAVDAILHQTFPGLTGEIIRSQSGGSVYLHHGARVENGIIRGGVEIARIGSVDGLIWYRDPYCRADSPVCLVHQKSWGEIDMDEVATRAALAE